MSDSNIPSASTAFLAVFFHELGDDSFITKEKRFAIKKAWQELDPSITDAECRQRMASIEREYYDKMGQWKSNQLKNRITKQLIDLQDQLQSAQTRGEVQRLSILLEKITKSSDLLAKINGVYEAAPTANITINTSVDTDALMKSLNKENNQ